MHQNRERSCGLGLPYRYNSNMQIPCSAYICVTTICAPAGNGLVFILLLFLCLFSLFPFLAGVATGLICIRVCWCRLEWVSTPTLVSKFAMSFRETLAIGCMAVIAAVSLVTIALHPLAAMFLILFAAV